MTPDEKTDAALRDLLLRRKRPEPPLDLAGHVMRRVAEQEQEAERRVASRPSAVARVVLSAYWLSAAAACISILERAPLPAWAAPSLWGLAVLAVPVSFAAALWPGSARAWLAAGVRPLAPPLER